MRNLTRKGGGNMQKKVKTRYKLVCLRTLLIISIADAELQPSDEEILGYSSDSSDEEDEPKVSKRNPSKNSPSSDDEAENEEEEEEEGWGASRKDYYNADEIQTEADALEEEAEAKRIQQKRLQKMTEADFGFDENDWLDSTKGGENEDRDIVTEVLKDVEITDEMGADERLRILRIRYPEFEFLADEFVALQPLLVELQQETEEENAPLGISSPKTVKFRALAAYIASLTMYFAILSSTTGKPMDVAELRDHPVMESLLQCRTLWTRVKALKALPTPPVTTDSDSDSHPEETTTKPTAPSSTSSTPPPSQPTKNSRLLEVEASLADLDSLLPSRNSSKSKSKPLKQTLKNDDSSSDFGEETSLSTLDAAKKAARKKSLKFYTSQITQKSQKRLGAGRDAGGDDDLPYRERFRDRQIRLNAEAEARGKVLSASGRGKKGADLDTVEGSEDETNEKRQQNGHDDDEYYNLITSNKSSKTKSKATALQAAQDVAAATALARIADPADLDDDQKRAIGYTIEKNKGLAPKRKKDVRNPRVKKRKKFEEKKKKLGSVRQVYKGGEERGGYGGEKTGIKSGLVKSVKL
jgi:U3 small nucleolar RNA-associated protein 3